MNIQQMMKQAQEMQTKMQKMQDQLGDVEIAGTAGGGMVTVLLNGKAEMKKLRIDPDSVDMSDIEMLEDLIAAAFNDAKNKVEQYVAQEMSKITSGMQLPPGFDMPS